MKNVFTVLIIVGLTVIHACKSPDEIVLPKMAAVAVSNVTVFGAMFASSVDQSGNQDVLEYGFVYSETEKAPTIVEDIKLAKGSLTPKSPTPVAFGFTLTGLKPNTTYYVRSYASMKLQTVYSEVVPFTTGSVVQPPLRTNDASGITIRSATLSGTLLGAGTYPITEYGIWWGTGSDPSAGGSKQSVAGDVATFPHSFSFEATNLTKTTTYNVRAYVVSNGVITYGESKSFTTPDEVPPGIQTGVATELTISSARLSGTLTTAGTYPVTEYGVCWGTSVNPTTASSKISVAGNVTVFPFSYTLNVAGLAVSTSYNYRAYVISNGVTTYGENNSFKTADVVQPGIRTGGSSDVSITTAKLLGTIATAGSYAITEYGVCWGLVANPTTSNFKAVGSGSVVSYPFTFTVNSSGLSASTNYNYRAYVISNGVTTYGENNTFKTADIVQPGIRTDGSSDVAITTTKLSGAIATAGSYAVAEYGICWGLTANPTTANSKAAGSAGVVSYPFTFTVNASGLAAATTYNYRAYVISNGVTSYGLNRTFRTNPVVSPEVTTVGYTFGATTATASLQGRIESAGSYAITEYGMCYSTSVATPTVNDTKAGRTGNPATFPFVYLQPISTALSKIHYYRSYVISNGTVTYGEVKTFTTVTD